MKKKESVQAHLAIWIRWTFELNVLDAFGDDFGEVCKDLFLLLFAAL